MRIALLGVVTAGVLSSCATTSLLTSWVDPDASGKKLGNVLVVGVARSAPARRQFEDSFAKVLASRRSAAVTSHAAARSGGDRRGGGEADRAEGEGDAR
jgi:hypothetical protein